MSLNFGNCPTVKPASSSPSPLPPLNHRARPRHWPRLAVELPTVPRSSLAPMLMPRAERILNVISSEPNILAAVT